MKSAYFASLFLVIGCGAAPSHGGDGGAESEKKDQQQATDPANADPSKPGAQDPNGAAAAPHSMLVENAAALPACTAAGEATLVYVKAEKKFKGCAGGAWGDVDIKGEKGDPGKDGADNHIIASISCGGQLQATSLWFTYSASLMSTGDIFVYGGIKSAAIQIGAPAFYSAKQNGATTASVIFTDDFESTSVAAFWDISLDRSTLVTTLKYFNAPGAAAQTWSMTPDKCIKNSY